MWRMDDPQCAEVGKVKYDLVPYVRGRLLDIGCGPFKIFPYAIGIDNGHHGQVHGWQYEPDVITDAGDLSMFAKGAIDSVFSSHLLEHIENPATVLKEWFRVLKSDGYLVLYLPHKDLYPNMGENGANEDHKHDFLPQDITDIMKKIGSWDLVVDEKREADYGEGSSMNEYSFLQIYQKKRKGQRYSCREPKPGKTAVVVRYGGFGDMIQASSVLPALKAHGYHVIFNTTPVGYEILKNDPNIDEFMLQDTDQVPNEELGNYWKAMELRCDRFINFSESVERSLLTMPGSTPHQWPKAARHRVTNINYLEFMHDIADVKHDFHPRFYPTEKELAWAAKERAKIGGDMVICISMSGSSVHKTWPHADGLIARLLMSYKNCRVVLLGNDVSVILERGWEDEERVIKRSGVWSIRESLTFVCHQADLIMGPETGVLNAAGMEPVPKVCLLSHSTKENLTKHWVNTVTVEPPKSVACYPCHQMHYNFDHCSRDEETGVATCQAKIPLEIVWVAVLGLLKKMKVLEKVG